MKTFHATVVCSDEADNYVIKVRAKDAEDAADKASQKLRGRESLGDVYPVRSSKNKKKKTKK